ASDWTPGGHTRSGIDGVAFIHRPTRETSHASLWTSHAPRAPAYTSWNVHCGGRLGFPYWCKMRRDRPNHAGYVVQNLGRQLFGMGVLVHAVLIHPAPAFGRRGAQRARAHPRATGPGRTAPHVTCGL